jgi:succinate dehydrogenase/fumarate reductase cytochrome b subunit
VGKDGFDPVFLGVTGRGIAVFVWIFHRISGLLLVVLLAFQFSTGFLQAGSARAESLKTAAALHRHAPLICALVFLATFHGLYGLRTILLDLGLRRERFLFWSSTLLGTGAYAAFLVFYFTRIAR